MKYSFAQIHADIDRHRQATDELAQAYADLQPPSFDPATKVYPNISPADLTPDSVAKTALDDAVEKEIDFQINMVGICLAQMETTNRIIELQFCYGYRVQPNGDVIQRAIQGDNKKFSELLNLANELHQNRQNPMLPSVLEEESYDEQMGELTNDHININEGRLRYQYRYAMKPPSLIENIFELRMEMIRLTLAASEEVILRLQQITEELKTLKIAKDERVVDNNTVDAYIEQNQAYCIATLDPMMDHLQKIEDFTNELKKMGRDPQQLGIYEPVHYSGISVNDLPTFKP